MPVTSILLMAAVAIGSPIAAYRINLARQQALDARRMPARELADGALILVGGTLLLTPGFVSDIAGLICVLPFTRPLVRGALVRFLTRRFLAPGTATRSSTASSSSCTGASTCGRRSTPTSRPATSSTTPACRTDAMRPATQPGKKAAED